MQSLKPVLIRWTDSEASAGWKRIDDIPDDIKASEIDSIGYLIKENNESIVISTSVSDNGSVMDPLTIPKCAILKRSDYPDA